MRTSEETGDNAENLCCKSLKSGCLAEREYAKSRGTGGADCWSMLLLGMHTHNT